MHQRKAHPYNYDHIFKTTADITTEDGHADSDFNQLSTQGEDHYHQIEQDSFVQSHGDQARLSTPDSVCSDSPIYQGLSDCHSW